MNFFKKLFDPGKTIEELVLKTGIQIEILNKFSDNLSPEYAYKSFKLLKKSGGYRTIDAPNRELKKLQKTIYVKLLKKLKIHPQATGFVPKKSIIDNTKIHVKKAAVVNIDLEDFFTNTSSERIYKYFNKIGWDKLTSKILTNICCYNKHLPQGAPTSPVLSNLINYKFDTRIQNLSLRFNIAYTRYADDLTFSFEKLDVKNRHFLSLISKIIKDEGYKIQKKKKVRIQRPHQRQTVTGLVVNQKVNLPRTLRRKIRAMQHYLETGKLSSEEQKKLEGYEALIKMVSK